jgi:hypothetical protein
MLLLVIRWVVSILGHFLKAFLVAARPHYALRSKRQKKFQQDLCSEK